MGKHKWEWRGLLGTEEEEEGVWRETLEVRASLGLVAGGATGGKDVLAPCWRKVAGRERVRGHA